MAESKPRRKLAAILAADVVGFSKKMGENEDRTLMNLKSCRAITDESIENHHGRIFGSAGILLLPSSRVLWMPSWQRLNSRKTFETETMNWSLLTRCYFGWVLILGM